MAIQNSSIPPSFVNEVVKILEDETIIRSNLKSVSGVYSWIEEYGRTLNKYHKSILPLTPQQPHRGANTVNDMSRRSRTGTRARGISLFFVDEFQAFDMATTKSGQCSLYGSCTFGLQTGTISNIPFMYGRDFPSTICFSSVDRRYFGREEFTSSDVSFTPERIRGSGSSKGTTGSDSDQKERIH
ncbi:hypothetical protein AVEN_97164-1 [Araneus ventricosus]|uniref:Uncharacterized protein n=1 Tax=Araneus ventricosus TaxID=182803 RepID=A0A4Y2DFL0_ARAVE|nr:hypothetical protein AVEN_97164-1 [Araneus ventricosus]